jgi:hypothetical protein
VLFVCACVLCTFVKGVGLSTSTNELTSSATYQVWLRCCLFVGIVFHNEGCFSFLMWCALRLSHTFLSLPFPFYYSTLRYTTSQHRTSVTSHASVVVLVKAGCDGVCDTHTRQKSATVRLPLSGLLLLCFLPCFFVVVLLSIIISRWPLPTSAVPLPPSPKRR